MLFNDLMVLCDNNDAFAYTDINHTDGAVYRLFNYRLASWSDFHDNLNALECRGSLFREDDSEWKCVSRPPEKFFNLHEGDVDHNFLNPMQIMVKEDGSLISTFIDVNKNLAVKSKGSLYSEHAQAAMNIIKNSKELEDDLIVLGYMGYTVNMEYCSVNPLHRIVISHETNHLVVLNVRHNETGRYLTQLEIKYIKSISSLLNYWVDVKVIEDVNLFIESVPNMIDIEGYVIQKVTGEHVKLKTLWYLERHRAKDTITNPKALFNAVLDEILDDVRELFIDDNHALELINKGELYVNNIHNTLVQEVESYHKAHIEMDRKGYAINGRDVLSSGAFGLAMMLYTDKIPDYKKSLRKLYKDEIFRTKFIDEVYL
jgi:T4 RnlA family RNA ligase